MNILVNGNRYKNFIKSSVTAKMGAMAREFEFTAATRGVGDIPFAPGDACEVWDDEDKLLTGFIERISLASGPKGHQYTLSGRDKLGDLVDSNLPRMNNLSIPLPAICQRVIDFLGIDATVIDEANTAARPFRTVISAEPEDQAVQFLGGLARRKQVLLQSNGDGNMVITQGFGRDVDTQLINRIQGAGNNMLSASLVIDHSQRFGRYTTEFQINMASAETSGLDTPPDQIVSQRFFIRDEQIRASRFRTTAADWNLSVADALKRPLWEIGLNRAESIKYSVLVPGFRNWQGNLWELNTAPTVIDEYNGILDKKMLISDIKYVLDGEGETTEMVLTDRDAFKAELKIRKDIELDGRSAT